MGLTAVTYWTATCDGECGQTLQDLTGGDYSAWADPGSVHDELVDVDAWVSDDGMVLCWDEAPRCTCGNVQSEDPNGPLCEDCDEEAAPCAD